MPSDTKSWDFFIAHAGPDKESAEAIFDKLSPAAGVFLDSRCLKLGDDWDIKLREAQKSSKVTLVLISENTDAAYYQREEIAAAIAMARSGVSHHVVPVYLSVKAASSETVPYGLRLKHGLILSDEFGLDELAAAAIDLRNSLKTDEKSDSTICRVTFDQSYQQDQWYGDASLSGGYSSIPSVLLETANCSVNSAGYESNQSLENTDILILPTPYRTIVPDVEYRRIIKWVQQGGGLLVFGFYLMDAHHLNNLNQLMRRLGVEFCHNLLMPIGRETFQECMAQSFAYQDSALWIETGVFGTASNHPILANVQNIALTSSCSVESAQSPELLVQTVEEVACFHAKGFKDPETGRMIRLTEYVLDRRGSASFMVAFKYGKGRVGGIGTWKVFLDIFLEANNFDNSKLLRNCIEWLKNA